MTERVLTAWCLGCGTVRSDADLMHPCPSCRNTGAYFSYVDLEAPTQEAADDDESDELR